MKKILICGLTENYGGLEAYVMDLLLYSEKTRVQFDFLFWENQIIPYLDYIEKGGGKCYFIPPLRRNPIAYYRGMRTIFDNNDYSAIYYQCNRRLTQLRVLKIAKKNGVKKVAVHSHNTREEFPGIINKIREIHVQLLFDSIVNTRLACSERAGRWMFGKSPFTVIHNPIDSERFRYNIVSRIKVRNELNISKDELVVGTVGRLSHQKNPLFMIDVFKRLRMGKKAKFLHLGDGELRNDMLGRISDEKLDRDYWLLGRRSNVEDYLSAMDVFILPSLYEGFPIALIEAQANGLRCVVSNVIDRDCNIEGNVCFLSINKPPSEWAERIEKESVYIRHEEVGASIKNKYDVAVVLKQVYDVFGM